MKKEKNMKKNAKKSKRNASGFFPFAAFVFLALATGLVVILIRSQA